MGTYKGALQPVEFEVVRGVFKRIASRSWFKDDIPTLNSFGLVVLHAYQGGIVDDELLYQHCLAASKALKAERH